MANIYTYGLLEITCTDTGYFLVPIVGFFLINSDLWPKSSIDRLEKLSSPIDIMLELESYSTPLWSREQ